VLGHFLQCLITVGKISLWSRHSTLTADQQTDHLPPSTWLTPLCCGVGVSSCRQTFNSQSS
jgi:hypothetical protein